MDFDEILHLLKRNNIKLHPKDWGYTVSLTDQIITSFDKLSKVNQSIEKLKEDEKIASNQNLPPKIKEYSEERKKISNSIIKFDEKLIEVKKLNETVSTDLQAIKNQINLLNNEITKLERKEKDLKTEHHQLKKIEKIESIEKNQKTLERKNEKLQKLCKKEEKYQALLKKLDKKKLIIEKAPKRKDLENVDLAAFEAPIPAGLRKNSMIVSDDDDDSSNQSKDDDDDSDEIIETTFRLSRMCLKRNFKSSNESLITTIKFAHTKSLIATGCEDGTVTVTKYTHEKVKNSAQFKFPNYEIISVDFGHNDENFLVSCSDLVIRLYKTKEWTLLDENDHFKKSINHAEFIHSHHKYVSCGKNCKIKIYDINKLKSVAKMKTASHPYYVSSSIGNHQLLSGHSDSSVSLWDTRSGKQTGSFKFNKGKVIQVLAVPNSTTAASLSINKQICLTDLRNFSLIDKIDVSCTNFDSYKTRMAIKDNFIVLGGQDGSIYSWSLKTFQLVSQKELCHNKIHVVDIKHDQNKISAGDSKGNVFIYY